MDKVDPLRAAQREIVREWFDAGHEAGRLDYDTLLDALAASATDEPGYLGVDEHGIIRGYPAASATDEGRSDLRATDNPLRAALMPLTREELAKLRQSVDIIAAEEERSGADEWALHWGNGVVRRLFVTLDAALSIVDAALAASATDEGHVTSTDQLEAEQRGLPIPYPRPAAPVALDENALSEPSDD